mmetsp:Transcript_6017/g.22027  ORF Transcript_6017/g.22027 Transcript_6017/m.22027 type:complete len:127 (-) Transcript_6017:176-556(-)
MAKGEDSGETGPSTEAGTSSVKTCTYCGTAKTPLWRSGPTGAKSLCNACGIKWKSNRLGEEGPPPPSSQGRNSSVLLTGEDAARNYDPAKSMCAFHKYIMQEKRGRANVFPREDLRNLRAVTSGRV